MLNFYETLLFYSASTMNFLNFILFYGIFQYILFNKIDYIVNEENCNISVCLLFIIYKSIIFLFTYIKLLFEWN